MFDPPANDPAATCINCSTINPRPPSPSAPIYTPPKPFLPPHSLTPTLISSNPLQQRPLASKLQEQTNNGSQQQGGGHGDAPRGGGCGDAAGRGAGVGCGDVRAGGVVDRAVRGVRDGEGGGGEPRVLQRHQGPQQHGPHHRRPAGGVPVPQEHGRQHQGPQHGQGRRRARQVRRQRRLPHQHVHRLQQGDLSCLPWRLACTRVNGVL